MYTTCITGWLRPGAILWTTVIYLGIAGQAVIGQVLQSGEWKQDGVGCAYREVFHDGRWQREYRQPIRQAIAWETSRHLTKVGFSAPMDIRRQSGMDAFGRCWSRDELGYAYYEVGGHGCFGREYYQPERRATAANLHRQLACVDWPAAVRTGASRATVHGFNAAGGRLSGHDAQVRSAVRDQIIDGLNRAGENRFAGDLSRFQQLVTEGVEDAVVRAFNQMDVLPGVPEGALPPNPQEHEVPERASPPNSPGSGADERSVLPHDPQQDPPVPSTDCGNSALTAGGGNRRLLAPHYGGPLYGNGFSNRYSVVQFVDSGWVIGTFGVRPLTGDAYLILSLKEDPKIVEVWSHSILLFEGCRYAKFFEDAQVLASRSTAAR